MTWYSSPRNVPRVPNGSSSWSPPSANRAHSLVRMQLARNIQERLHVSEADPECAPVASVHEDRRRQVLHEHELPAAHVAPVGLQQEGLRVGRDLLHRAVIEQAAITAMSGIPGRIVAR